MDPDLASRLASIDARVRARAGLELARRIAVDPGAAPVLAHHLEQERDEDALVAIVRELPDDAPLAIRAACGARLERASTTLRGAILDRVLAWTAGFPDSLRARVPHEQDAVLRGRLLEAWLERLGADDAVTALADAPYPVLADLLARSAPGSIAWDALAPIVARGIPALEPLVLPHLADAEHPVRQRLLANVVARSLEPAVIGAPLRQDLAARALGLLDPIFDREGTADPVEAEVHRRLLGAAERVLHRADADRLDPAEHALLGRVARIRRRVGARDPRGWLGAVLPARRERGPTTVIEHTVPDGTSTMVLTVAGLELRAHLRDVRALAASLPSDDARAILAIDYDRPTAALDPGALHRAIRGSTPRRPALAGDLARLADTAVVRGTTIGAELVEGWLEDPAPDADDPETRATLVDPRDPRP